MVTFRLFDGKAAQFLKGRRPDGELVGAILIRPEGMGGVSAHIQLVPAADQGAEGGLEAVMDRLVILDHEPVNGECLMGHVVNGWLGHREARMGQEPRPENGAHENPSRGQNWKLQRPASG